MIISASTPDGSVLMDEKSHLERLKRIEEHKSSDTYAGQFFLGLLVGLVLATIHHFILFICKKALRIRAV